MKTIRQLRPGLGLAGIIGLMALVPASVHAQLTAADVNVTNTATVSYEIDNVDQPDETGTVTFEVDALINPVVALVDAPDIVPDEQNVAVEFTVTNGGNQTQDFVLNGLNPTGDDDDLDNLEVYIDDGDGVFEDDGSDLLVDIANQSAGQGNLINDLAPGASVTVFIVGDVPADIADNEDIDVHLVAVAYQSDGSGIEVETPAGSATQGAVDTIFGDTLGPAATDDDEDGEHSAEGTLSTDQVTVTVTKTAVVIDNGLDDGSSDQFYIPGATVRYTITIDYAGSTDTSANAIVMSDPIPANTTYVPGSITLNTVGQTDGDDSPGTDFSDFNITNAGAVTVAIQGTRNGGSADDVITFDVIID